MSRTGLSDELHPSELCFHGQPGAGLMRPTHSEFRFHIPLYFLCSEFALIGSRKGCPFLLQFQGNWFLPASNWRSWGWETNLLVILNCWHPIARWWCRWKVLSRPICASETAWVQQSCFQSQNILLPTKIKTKLLVKNFYLQHSWLEKWCVFKCGGVLTTLPERVKNCLQASFFCFCFLVMLL